MFIFSYYRTLFALFFALAVSLMSCEKEKIDVKSFEPSDFLFKNEGASQGEVNGQPINVKFKAGTNLPNPTSVNFVITGAGKFSNGLASLTQTIKPGDSLELQIFSTTVGTALVAATVLDYTKTLDISFINSANGFSLSILNDNVAANNIAEAQLEVKVSNPGALGNPQQVTFTTSGGSFRNNQQQITQDIDSNSTATAFIKSSSPGVITVTATINNITKTAFVRFAPVVPALNNFTLAVSQNNTPADNVSEANIKVKINIISGTSAPNVTFTTTKGTFSDGTTSITVPVSLDSTATVHLKHNRAETAVVTATVAGLNRQTTVSFSHARPETIIVSPSAAVINNNPGANVQVSAELLRNNGSVSPGQIVLWYDSTSTGASPGIFLNVSPSTVNSTSTATYHLQDTTFLGDIFLKARVNTGTGNVRGSTKIVVTD